MSSRPMRAPELKSVLVGRHALQTLSRPMRARELKSIGTHNIRSAFLSRPMRARELKYFKSPFLFYFVFVAPHAGA